MDQTINIHNLKAEGCDGQLIFRDNLGKTIKVLPVNSNKYSLVISTSDLSNGVYYLSLQCNNNFIATEKIVIQH